jgi:hypothetical protein
MMRIQYMIILNLNLTDGAYCVALEDELFVDDERGCETLFYATDLRTQE